MRLFFQIGVTLLVFKIAEKESLDREILNKTNNWTDISFFINFKTFIGLVLGSEDFWEQRAEIIELIAFLSVGERKKVYIQWREEFMKFLEEYLIEDCIFRATFEK